MPRNKAYESLERLASRGIIDVQPGRPMLYRASGAKMVIDSLTENYGREAKEALEALEERQETGRGSPDPKERQRTHGWSRASRR